MYYRTNRKYYKRNRIYTIWCNGAIIGTVLGKNSRSALLEFCRWNGIPSANGESFGRCGMPISQCAQSVYGLRPCGSRSKCIPTYMVPSPMGILVVK